MTIRDEIEICLQLAPMKLEENLLLADTLISLVDIPCNHLLGNCKDIRQLRPNVRVDYKSVLRHQLEKYVQYYELPQ